MLCGGVSEQDLDEKQVDQFEGRENAVSPRMTGLSAGSFDGFGAQKLSDILPDGSQYGIKTAMLWHSGASFPTGCVTTPWYRKPSLHQDQAT